MRRLGNTQTAVHRPQKGKRREEVLNWWILGSRARMEVLEHSFRAGGVPGGNGKRRKERDGKKFKTSDEMLLALSTQRNNF